MTDSERQVFWKALEVYGKQAQIAITFEEMAELQKELCKNLRGTQNKEHIAEEIADVSIMLDQMQMFFGVEALTVEERQRKVTRLALRLERDVQHRCETCHWWDSSVEVCCCDKSKHRGDYTLSKDRCALWEEAK